MEEEKVLKTKKGRNRETYKGQISVERQAEK